MSTRVSVNEHLPDKAKKMILRIQDALSIDLLDKKYRRLVNPFDHPTRGHCYIATEALYYLWGVKAKYQPCTKKCSDGGSHWWLRHRKTKLLADPTEPQVVEGFSYVVKGAQWFENPSPSPRAKELMRRVRSAIRRDKKAAR